MSGLGFLVADNVVLLLKSADFLQTLDEVGVGFLVSWVANEQDLGRKGGVVAEVLGLSVLCSVTYLQRWFHDSAAGGRVETV